MRLILQRLTFIFVIVLLTVIRTKAEEISLVIRTKSGTPVGYALSKKPVLTFIPRLLRT